VPPFEGATIEGKPIKLSDFRGKPVLLYFWAAAAISTFDIQILKELNTAYAKEDKLVILGMNLDSEASAAAQYAKAQGMTWPHAHLGAWGETQVPAAFGVEGYPVGLLINAEGKLIARQLRASALRNAVRNALRPTPQPAPP
jgi:peroxiredoxin